MHEERPGCFAAVPTALRVCGRAGLVALWILIPLLLLGAAGGGLLYVRLLNGPVQLKFLAEPIARAITDELPGMKVTVDDAHVWWTEADGLEFRLADVRFADASDVPVAVAPLASVRLSGLGLMSGVLSPSSIVLIEPRLALLDIDSTPPGATIFVDRRDLGARGVTPATLAVTPGEHVVIVEMPGHEVETSEPMNAEIGQRAVARLKLTKVVGVLHVVGEPAGAEIRINAADAPVVGRLPGEIEVPPGAHTLHISAPGRRNLQLPVNVEPRQRSRVQADLAMITGTVVVDADEVGALIEVDGQAAGFAPAAGLTTGAEVPAPPLAFKRPK
jgi:hypothetical protein